MMRFKSFSLISCGGVLLIPCWVAVSDLMSSAMVKYLPDVDKRQHLILLPPEHLLEIVIPLVHWVVGIHKPFLPLPSQT